MRKLVHTAAIITLLALPIRHAWGADTLFPIAGQQSGTTGDSAAGTAATPDATSMPQDGSTQPDTNPQPNAVQSPTAGTSGSQDQPVQPDSQQPMTTEGNPASTATQPAAASQDQSTQPDTEAQPEKETQPNGPDQGQGQAAEEDTTQSSGPMTATDKIVNHFMALDTDQDDSVSFDEYMAMVQQRAKDRFAAMDANGDGQVTAEEYRKFWKERKAQWYRLRR